MEDSKAIIMLQEEMKYHRKDHEELKAMVAEINEKLDKRFVTKEQFWPVKTLVYSGAGIILSSACLAGISLIFNHVK